MGASSTLYPPLAGGIWTRGAGTAGAAELLSKTKDGSSRHLSVPLCEEPVPLASELFPSIPFREPIMEEVMGSGLLMPPRLPITEVVMGSFPELIDMDMGSFDEPMLLPIIEETIGSEGA